MTQDEFDKAPLLDQILYDETGMLVKNHPDIKDCMQKYADQQLILSGVTQRSEQFFALLRYTMPDQFTDVALKNIVKGFIEQSK